MMGDFRGSEILQFLDRFNLEPVDDSVRDLYEVACENIVTNPQKAIQRCEWALAVLQKEKSSTNLDILKEAAGRCHLLLGCIYLNQEKELLTKARSHYRQSEEIFSSKQWSHLISLANFGLAITLRKQKRLWEDAHNACAEAEEKIKNESIPSNVPKIVIEELRKAISKERLEIISQEETVSRCTLSVFEIKSTGDIIDGIYPQRQPRDVSLLKGTDFGKVVGSKRDYDKKEVQRGNFVVCFSNNFASSSLSGKEILIEEIKDIEVADGKEIIFFIVEEDVRCVFAGRRIFRVYKDTSDAELHHYYLRSVPNDNIKKDVVVLLPTSQQKKITNQYPGRFLICRQASQVVILGAYVKTL